MTLHALHTGELAYFDSIVGLLPCRLISLHDDGDAIVYLTASRPGWQRGEKVRTRATRVVDRNAVSTRSGQLIITGHTIHIPTDALEDERP